MKPAQQFYGELLGTFLLVFFGCGSVAVAVLFEAYAGLFQIAAIWGIGLTLAITITAPLSGAHLNPAITLAFALLEKFPKRQLPLYFSAQFLGAFLAAAALYLLFGSSIANYESASGIVRGTAGSEASAKVFGEFHPASITTLNAAFAEFCGTALLAFIIFNLSRQRQRLGLPAWVIPPAIGLSLTLLISLFAPLSMAGFNPARDLAPRLFSALVGWKSIPFTTNGASWFLAYLVGPFLGAIAGGCLAKTTRLREE